MPILIYLAGMIFFFAGSIPFIFHSAQDVEESTIFMFGAMCAAMIWPIALPIGIIVAVGKWLKYY